VARDAEVDVVHAVAAVLVKRPRWHARHLAVSTMVRRAAPAVAAPSAAGTTKLYVGLLARAWMNSPEVPAAAAKRSCGLPWRAMVPLVPAATKVSTGVVVVATFAGADGVGRGAAHRQRGARGGLAGGDVAGPAGVHPVIALAVGLDELHVAARLAGGGIRDDVHEDRPGGEVGVAGVDGRAVVAGVQVTW